VKKATDDLFRLIKSLTKSEKGYFKKYASKNAPGGKSNYVLLFDAIDEMEAYDEELLRKKLKNQAFVSQIPVYKVYLFNLILKSLTLYGAFENTETKLSEMIRNAKILEKKQMHREALKILKKAKEIAYKYENEKSMVEILFQERGIYMVMPDKNVLEKRKEIHEEQMKLLNQPLSLLLALRPDGYVRRTKGRLQEPEPPAGNRKNNFRPVDEIDR